MPVRLGEVAAAVGALGAVVLGLLAVGCGGGAPLLHPAHVLSPGTVQIGGGLSGQLEVTGLSQSLDASQVATLRDVAIAPSVAPWVGGRVGIEGSNEAGITYTSRALRVDGRHAFSLGAPTLSVGAGVSGILAQRPGQGLDASSVYGGGVDVPILLGIRSKSDIYALWLGPRVGFEYLSGSVALTDVGTPNETLADVTARHFYAGVVVGMMIGFRHVHVALEGDLAFHDAEGSLAGTPVSLTTMTITPGGALLITF